MKKLLLTLGTILLITGCGPSQEEREKVAAVTCSIMSETRNMDAAVRVQKMNDAREKIGGEPFLSGDYAIKEALEFGLCQELVLNETYDERLLSLKVAERKRKDAKRESERVYELERREWYRKNSEEEKQAERERQRIIDSKPTIKEEFHSNGSLKSRINFQPISDGGKKDGLSEIYYDNGQLRYKENYKDGKQDGLREWYHENGQSESNTNYKDGKKDGLDEGFNKKGQLLWKFCYKNDEQTDMSYCEK